LSYGTWTRLLENLQAPSAKERIQKRKLQMLHISARRSRLQRCRKIESIPGWNLFGISLEEEWRGCRNFVGEEQSPPRHERTFLCRAAVGKCRLSNARRVQKWNGSGIENCHLSHLVSPTFQFPGKAQGAHPLQDPFYFCNLYRISRSAGEWELVGDYRQLDRGAITCIALHLDLIAELGNGLA